MTDLLFDKLAYKDKLTASGVPEATARAHADALDEALREGVATKRDLRALAAFLFAVAAFGASMLAVSNWISRQPQTINVHLDAPLTIAPK